MPGADRELFRASRPARRHLITSVGLGLLTAALIVAQAMLLARVIDDIAFQGASAADVQGDVLLLIAAALGRGLLAAGFETSGRYGAARAMADLRARLTAHVLYDRPGELSGERAGELAATAVQGVDALEAYFARYLPQAVLACAVPVAIIVVVLPLDTAAAVIMAVTIPVIVLFMILIGKGAAARTRARWSALSRLSAHFLDVVEGLTTLRANDRAGAQEATIAVVGDDYRRETMGTLRIAFLSSFVLELAAMIGTALVAATIGVQLVNGSIAFTAGLTVLLLAPELYLPVRQLGAQFHASADGLAAAERIFDVLRTPPALAPATATQARVAPDPRTGAITLRDAGFAYPGRPEPALDGVDLDIAPGETVALVGPSGAGKSTLAALAVRLADPGTGVVACDGVDLRTVEADAWRARCAWVPQRATLFAGTVADNIRLADPAASDERVRAAARAAEALETIEALPGGFATPVGEGGRTLSAGQVQRIALARAFLTDAPFVVLDEPTAHLDEETAAAVSTAIERLCRDRSALLVVHRPALAALADRIVTLEGGRVVAPVGRMSTPSATEALRGALAATRSRRGRLWASVVLGAVAIGASIGLLTTSGYLISRAAQRPDSILVVSAAIVAVRAFGILRALSRYAERLVSHDLAFRVLADVRLRVFTRLVALVPADVRDLRRGDLLSRFVGDVDTLQDLYLRGLAPPLVAALTSLLSVGVAALMLPAAGLVLAAGLLAGIVLVPLATAATTRGAARRQGPARAALTTDLVEIVRGAAELAVAGRADDRAARAAAADGELARAQTRDALAGGLAAGLGVALTGATAACVALVCAPAVRDGSLSPVLVAAVVLLTLAAFEGVVPLGDAARGVLRSATAAQRIAQVTERAPTVIDRADPRPLPATGDLVLTGVRRRHEPDGPWILDGADLTLAPGRSIALVGPSGIGKSTLADLLVRFADPQEGVVTLGGTDLRELAQDDVRRAVRLVGQGAHLFATTIRQNVLLARPEATDDEVAAALAHVGLGAWLATLPDGLDTFVGEQGAQVSGGQRARIAAARGVLTDARFRLFDEPAAHLDPAGAQDLLRALAGLARDGGPGVLVITHGADGLDAFDEVLVLEDGRLRTRPPGA